jgi:hypothetical protein
LSLLPPSRFSLLNPNLPVKEDRKVDKLPPTSRMGVLLLYFFFCFFLANGLVSDLIPPTSFISNELSSLSMSKCGNELWPSMVVVVSSLVRVRDLDLDLDRVRDFERFLDLDRFLDFERFFDPDPLLFGFSSWLLRSIADILGLPRPNRAISSYFACSGTSCATS